ncbi:type VI secretion system-associated FHA domain protein TagH [Shewanella salipaludis]
MRHRDMLLELSVISYHRLSPRQLAVKRFGTQGGTLGRSEQADWCLPDPERVVSGIHAQITFSQDEFIITDLSTNGLFLNRGIEPVGQDNRATLSDGDVLCLGDYEIKVAIVDESASTVSPLFGVDQPQAVPQSIPQAVPGAGVAVAAAIPHAGLALADIAKVHPHSSELSLGTEMPELDPLTQHFMPPSSLIPDDWEGEWANAAATPRLSEPRMSESGLSAHNPLPKHDRQAMLSHSAAPQGAGDGRLAFLQGLGLTDCEQYLAYPDAWWGQLGNALQESLSGILQIMRARSEIKNTFRVNQTTFQQRENNPLKFSAGIEDAFHNLFNRPSNSFMPAKQAIREAFLDIEQHEAAIIAGAKGAVNGVLSQLSPLEIEKRDYASSFLDKVNPAQRQARYWNVYQSMHQDLSSELGKMDKKAVSDDFIHAYEEFMKAR